MLSFDDMSMSRKVRMGMVSAGGYHHHISYNTWQGEAAPHPPPDALGLGQISFILSDREAWLALMVRLEELQLPYNQTDDGILLTDPSQNEVLFERP